MANRTSRIILAKGIKIDRAYKNILSYSESDMLALLRSNSHYVNELSNCSFIRKTSTIMVDITYEQAIQSNYIAFQNPDYSNKWFFAWIDEIKYIGERNIEISYTIDDWSTWSGNLVKKACWVEREHVADDSIGAHLLDEGLACTNYNYRNVTIDPMYLQDPYIVVMSTYDLENDRDMAGSNIWNGAVNGAKAYIFRFKISNADYCILDFEKFLLATNTKGKKDAIQNIFIIPAAVVGLEPSEGGTLLTGHSYSIAQGQISGKYYTLDGFTFNPATFTTHVRNLYNDFSYVPHNNKCYCYPYHYLFVTNNNGNANIYKGELFSDRTNIEFTNQLALTPGVSGRIAPLNYKGSSYNYDESLTLGKFPECGWSNDEYINWLTQNAINEPTKILNSVLGIGNSVSGYNKAKASDEGVTAMDTANLAGNIVGNVAGIIGDFYSANLLPSSSAGSNVGDIGFCTYSLRFDFYNMVLCDEELRIIDNYFTRFGYKVNSLKIPEFNSRPYWNYIKITEGENIGYGIIPSKAMDTINKIFRTGTSVWHSHDNLGNFSLANW